MHRSPRTRGIRVYSWCRRAGPVILGVRRLAGGEMARAPKRAVAAFLVGGVLFLVAGFTGLWVISSSEMRCQYCDCSFALDAADAYCRLPAVLVLVTAAILLASLGMVTTGWWWRRRE